MYTMKSNEEGGTKRTVLKRIVIKAKNNKAIRRTCCLN